MLFSTNKKYSAFTDHQLVEEYRLKGNKDCVGELFKRHAKTALGACMYYLENKEEAQDAVMQIFDKLYIELRKTEVEYFKGWLSFVLRNHCIGLIRKKKTEHKVFIEYAEFEKEEANWEQEEKIAKVNDNELSLDFLRTALTQLKEKHRVCIQLFFLENKSYVEISTHTGYSINEVKSYIQNGKRNLKIMISDLYNSNAKTSPNE